MSACHDFQSQMTAYVHDELPPLARRRLARHIQQCSACYIAYARERDLARELEFRVALVGQPRPAELKRVWSAIQQDMRQPRSSRLHFRLRYGLAAFMFTLGLLLPWRIQGQVKAVALIALPPVPTLTTAARTPAQTGMADNLPTLIAFQTSAESESTPVPPRAPVPHTLAVTP